jgi:ATP-dependent Lhr-like helicase
MEARGELRGGRFVGGFSGEQYALPEAVVGLRDVRRKPDERELVSVSGSDPLNLLGLLVPGPRVPVHPRNRILYRGGVPVAVRIAGETSLFETHEPGEEHRIRTALSRRLLSPAARAAVGSIS